LTMKKNFISVLKYLSICGLLIGCEERYSRTVEIVSPPPTTCSCSVIRPIAGQHHDIVQACSMTCKVNRKVWDGVIRDRSQGCYCCDDNAPVQFVQQPVEVIQQPIQMSPQPMQVAPQPVIVQQPPMVVQERVEVAPPLWIDYRIGGPYRHHFHRRW